MTTTPEPAVAAGLRASYSLYRLPPEWSPDETHGLADIDVTTPEGARGVAHVAFTLAAWPPLEVPAEWADSDGCDVRLDFDVPRIDPAHRDELLDLRLVAGLMAAFSVGRTVMVRVVAEERGWQSHRLTRRESRVPAIMRYWRALDLHPSVEPYSCQAAVVSRVVRDYRVPPGLATWGRRFELARRSIAPVPGEMELLWSQGDG